MTNKITHGGLLALDNAINMLEASNQNLPFKVWYALNKNRKLMYNPLNLIKDSRKKLLDKYASIDEDGKYKTELVNNALMFVFKDEESKAMYDSDMQPVLNDEVEIEFYTIDIKEFDGLSTSIQEQPLIGILFEYLIK